MGWRGERRGFNWVDMEFTEVGRTWAKLSEHGAHPKVCRANMINKEVTRYLRHIVGLVLEMQVRGRRPDRAHSAPMKATPKTGVAWRSAQCPGDGVGVGNHVYSADGVELQQFHTFSISLTSSPRFPSSGFASSSSSRSQPTTRKHAARSESSRQILKTVRCLKCEVQEIMRL